MKVTVITGSAHKSGTSAILADKFIEGAKEAGHEVYRFDAAFEKVSPCLACEHCSANNGKCVYEDSMDKLNEQLIDSDVVVFATPLYYYTFSAQVKAVIDRFHAKNTLLAGNKKAILMATSFGDAEWTMDGIDKTFELTLGFMNWENAGTLYAVGCPVREAIEASEFPQKAYEMGKNL